MYNHQQTRSSTIEENVINSAPLSELPHASSESPIESPLPEMAREPMDLSNRHRKLPPNNRAATSSPPVYHLLPIQDRPYSAPLPDYSENELWNQLTPYMVLEKTMNRVHRPFSKVTPPELIDLLDGDSKQVKCSKSKKRRLRRKRLNKHIKETKPAFENAKSVVCQLDESFHNSKMLLAFQLKGLSPKTGIIAYNNGIKTAGNILVSRGWYVPELTQRNYDIFDLFSYQDGDFLDLNLRACAMEYPSEINDQIHNNVYENTFPLLDSPYPTMGDIESAFF